MDFTTLFADPFSLIMLAMLGLLIIFMFRSNRKRQAAQRELQEGMRPGVEVMLQSGVFGTIKSIDEEANRVTVESGPGTVLIVHRNAVANVVPEAIPAESSSNTETPDVGITDAGSTDESSKG